MPQIKGQLDADGAVIRVTVMIEEADEIDRRARGLVPEMFTTMALLDTGAMQTAVDPIILEYLGMMSHTFAPVRVPGQPTLQARLYDVRLSLDQSRVRRPLFEVQALGIAPATSSVFVLIGRDVLERCTFVFDGRNKSFNLSF